MAELLILAAAVYGFALLSGRLVASPITAPMAFTGVGLLVGTGGLGWFEVDVDGEAAQVLIEATLVLVLFTDAVRIDLPALRDSYHLPLRLLGLGLPLTLLAGTGVGWLLFDELSLVEAALLAAVLTPTDAALGQAVVCDRRLPVRLRQSLNVESGLNDGFMVPIVTVLLAASAAEDAVPGDWTQFLLRQLGFGLGAGVLAGLLGGRLLMLAIERGWVEGVYRQLATVAIAVGAFAGAELGEGNGFIAAFVAGLTFGWIGRAEGRRSQEFTEDEGELLTAATFLVFGAALIGPRLDDVSWEMIAYAAASLTAVRMVPVALALLGSGLGRHARGFMAWFGPRGLASILFALVVAEELGSESGDLILTVAGITVLASVMAHGLSAAPWTTRLADRLAEGPADMAEHEPMPEMPTRRLFG